MGLGPLVPVEKNSKAIKVKDWQTLSPSALSELIKGNNGGNIGVRLDHYAVLDPDEPAAEAFANDLERQGKLDPTVSWKTARGYTKRLYQRPDPWPFASQTANMQGMKLQLRSGSGVQDLIPPSTINGEPYTWIQHQSPDDISPAPLPHHILDIFISCTSTSTIGFLNTNVLKTTSTNICNQRAKTISFDEGARDESLFHVALALFKGGEPYENVLEIITRIAMTCDPPFSMHDAEKKVESAQKRFLRKERNMAEEVRDFVLSTNDYFKSTDIYISLGLSTTVDKKTANQALNRLCAEGVVTKAKRGLYRQVEGEAPTIDYDKVDPDSYLRIKWPLRFENLVKIFPRSLCIVAGSFNAGKTSYLLEFCRLNMYDHSKKIRYISTEMEASELRERLEYYANDGGELFVDIADWKKHVDFRLRHNNIIDLIMPNYINLIDYYQAEGEFFEIAKEMRDIQAKLDKGICIMALQKKPGSEFAYGGALTAQLPRFVINLDKGKLKIIKAKNLMPGIDRGADGFTVDFKLVKGYKWMPQNKAEIFWYYNYEDKEDFVRF